MLDVEGEKQVLDEEVKVQKPRKVTTLETHLASYDALIEKIDAEINKKKINMEGGVRPLQSIAKRLKIMKTEVPRVCKRKRKRSTNTSHSGFSKTLAITPELRSFLKLPNDEYPTRIEIVTAICVYIKVAENDKRESIVKWKHLNTVNRNLQDPKDRSFILFDKRMKKLLNTAQYEKDVKAGKVTIMKKNKTTGEKEKTVVTDKSIKYITLQRLVNRHILGNSESPPTEENK